jgi:hypothetical protein
MRPELAKPTSMIVVALLDWMTAVMNAPTIMALKRLLVMELRICRIRPPAACCRPSPTSCIPYRSRAIPPKSAMSIAFVIAAEPLAGRRRLPASPARGP